MKPESMKEFFEARINTYDAHMLNEVEGCREGYAAMAAALPDKTEYLLDLGTGTGLELAPILARFPEVAISAIDLSGIMLARMREKYPDAQICAVAGDYTKMKLGIAPFYNAAISFQAFHHHLPSERLSLYQKIHAVLLTGGVYIEGDYTACDDGEEIALREAASAARKEHGFADDTALHLDIPLTEAHTTALLYEAGFTEVKRILAKGRTTVLVAKK